MKTKTKLMLFGLSAFLILTGATLFAVAEENGKTSIGVIEITDFNESKPLDSFFVSQIYKTDFPFTGLGLEWQGKTLPTQINFFLKILNNGGWSEWFEVRQEEKDVPDFYPTNKNLSDIIFVSGQEIQLKVVLTDRTPNSLDWIKIHYFNSATNLKVQTALVSADELNIIPRANWIANEVDELTRISTWAEDYKDIKKFVIHHTGSALKDLNNDGVINQSDYDIALQGVYNWHAKSLGWGDIGYNFIIDPSGRIFEGRIGGDGVVGGHTIRDASCNKTKTGTEETIGFNKGTIGIAILGDSDKEAFSPAAKQALINLIAYKSLEFGIEPNGQGFFADNNYQNVVGHRDLDCTSCPGHSVYSALSEVRELSQKKFGDLGGLAARVPKAKFIAQSEQTIILKDGVEKKVWVEFKNEGKTSWHNYTDEPIYLAPENIKTKLALIDSLRIASEETNETPLVTYRLDKPNVKPGEIGRVTFTVKSPENKIIDVKKLLLAWGEKGWLPDTDVQFTITATELDYGATLDSLEKPTTLFENSNPTFTLKFKNIGTKTWGQNEIYLAVYNTDYKISFLKDKSWPTASGGLRPEETEVAPSQFATFTLPIKTGKPGIYRQLFSLVRKITLDGQPEIVLAEEKIIGSDFETELRVDSVYQAELTAENLPDTVMISSRPAVTLKFKNTGLKTWKRGATVLRVLDGSGKRSKFFDRGDWLDREVAAWLVEKEVKPNEMGTFKFYLRTPKTAGKYEHKIVLEHKGQNIFINKQSAFWASTEVTKRKK